MITKSVNECTTKALNEPLVSREIEGRDRNQNTTLTSISSKIIRRQSNTNFFRMIVRVAIDYALRDDNGNPREDILVDVSFVLDKRTKAETFDIINVTFVPEIED